MQLAVREITLKDIEIHRRITIITGDFLGYDSRIKPSSATNPTIVNFHSLVLRSNGRKAAKDCLGHNILL
ncbi:hypothetical protein [Legionella sainthelensi]|uniref:Uncharacterized protein n=1 Tax=Legionella sainthelensi TaxID=28087 RepID=A0A2H5FIT7_9GAMM|nr:hypothetical protein [Legionella sainthelensi]AUH71455.1 hypothetical protein CAB17_04775 [Legionella sainthelensi]